MTSAKNLTKRGPQSYRFHYQEFHIVQQEVEAIVNKSLLTYFYCNYFKTCLTANQSLFGKSLSMYNRIITVTQGTSNFCIKKIRQIRTFGRDRKWNI